MPSSLTELPFFPSSPSSHLLILQISAQASHPQGLGQILIISSVVLFFVGYVIAFVIG